MRDFVGNVSLDDACCKSRKVFAVGIIRGELGEVLSPPPVLVRGRERRSNSQARHEYLQSDAYRLRIREGSMAIVFSEVLLRYHLRFREKARETLVTVLRLKRPIYVLNYRY